MTMNGTGRAGKEAAGKQGTGRPGTKRKRGRKRGRKQQAEQHSTNLRKIAVLNLVFATTIPVIDRLGGHPVREKVCYVARSGKLIAMHHHEHSILGGNDIRLEECHAGRGAERVGGFRVFGDEGVGTGRE